MICTKKRPRPQADGAGCVRLPSPERFVRHRTLYLISWRRSEVCAHCSPPRGGSGLLVCWTEPPRARDALEVGEVPPPTPFQGAQPLPPDGKCQPQWPLSPTTTAPQPLWQPPPTVCPTASGAASEDPSLPMQTCLGQCNGWRSGSLIIAPLHLCAFPAPPVMSLARPRNCRTQPMGVRILCAVVPKAWLCHRRGFAGASAVSVHHFVGGERRR